MALLIGAFLALAVGLLATAAGLDRDRAFYPTVTIVIATYYVLFAVMGASTSSLLLESLVAAQDGGEISVLPTMFAAAGYLAWMLKNGRIPAAA